MTDAPERIYTCSHLGEYGRYYPEAVEAEGEHGGSAVEYVRADLVGALVAAAYDAAAQWCEDRSMEIPMDAGARKWAGMFLDGDAFLGGGTHVGQGYADAIRALTIEDARKVMKVGEG